MAFYVALLFVIGAPWSWWAFPKSEPHPMDERNMTAHYRGFGLWHAGGLFGKRWIAVTHKAPHVGGYWRFEFEDEGYNLFRGYYPDGTLREVGQCLVERMGIDGHPYPDPHDLKWSRCYRPDGSLASEVIDGSGTQTIFFPDGTLSWKLELSGDQRVSLSMLHPNGQLRTEGRYVADKRHGPFTSYDESGRKTMQGAYADGVRVGTWTWYNADGSIQKTQVY